MATRKGFLDLPPELRNQIYKDYISTFKGRPVIKPGNLCKSACKSIGQLVKALNLKHAFPHLFTSKQIMYEALPFCLDICNLRLHDLDDLDAVRSVRHNTSFRSIGANIRYLTLDISWFGHGIDFPREHHPTALKETKTLVPLPGTLTCWYFPRPYRSQPCTFAKLLAELENYFPNTTSICVEVDRTTLLMQSELKRDLLTTTWPSLRDIKFKRLDLERRVAVMMEGDFLFHPRRSWPRQPIPWELDLESRYIESMNEGLARSLHGRRDEAGR